MHNVLVLGGSGLVGKALISEMNKYSKFQIYATYFQRPLPLKEDKIFELDANAPTEIDNILEASKPEIVISCLRGDYNKQLVLHTKTAEYLKETDGRLYFFSTANVFDNDSGRPHYEEDIPDSCTDYGQYKIECEKRMIEILHDNACILRLPQVWGIESPRMVQLLNALKNNEEIVVYPKLFINTNTDISIAKQLCHIIEHKLTGNFHLAAEDVISYKDFYCKLIMELGYSNARLQENFKEEGYFALLSKRGSEFPEELRLTNKSVINYLAG